MLENISDYISLFTMALFVIAALSCGFMISDKHHDAVMKHKEQNYYAFYEDMNDEDDDEKNDLYYE